MTQPRPGFQNRWMPVVVIVSPATVIRKVGLGGVVIDTTTG